MLGMIISKEYDISQLKEIREKYDLGLYKINNKYVSDQLSDNEIFLQATRTGFDSLTGIGAYDYYTQDITKIYDVIEDRRIAEASYTDLKYRKDSYEKDALKWIELIKILKDDYKVGVFGVFWHMYTTSIEKEEIYFSKKIYCNLSDISLEYLMKIERDVIVFFE